MRLVQLLRQLTGYNEKEPGSLVTIHIVHDLARMSKSALGSIPFFQTVGRYCVTGLLMTLTAFTLADSRTCANIHVLTKFHVQLCLLCSPQVPSKISTSNSRPLRGHKHFPHIPQTRLHL